MITWITEDIATAAYTELDNDVIAAGLVTDIRELVDKHGNSFDALIAQIEYAHKILQQRGKVYIACDMGVSRSRVIAIGLLTQMGWSFDAALSHVIQVAKKPEINLALLRTLAQHVKSLSVTLNAADRSKLLLLGGGGFVGGHLCNALSTHADVQAPSSNQINLTTDAIELSRFVENKSSQIILYAAHPKSHHSTSAFSSSLAMLKNALDVAREHSLIFVYISGMVVFNGNARLAKGGEFVAHEKDQPIPYGTYSESKFFGESLVQLYQQNYGLKTSIIRAPGLYGPRMSGTWLIPKLIKKALEGLPISTHQYLNGLPQFDLLHIRDFCSAVETLLLQDRMPEVVHVGSANLVSTHELAQTIVDLTHSNSAVSFVHIEDQVQNVKAADSEIMRYLGWTPTVTFREGLVELIS